MDHFRSLGPVYPIAMSIAAVLFLAATRIRNEWFHAAFAVISLTYLLLYPIMLFDTVNK